MSIENQESEAVEFDSLTTVLKALRPLSADGRERVLASVQAFFGMSGRTGNSHLSAVGADSMGSVRGASRDDDFSEDRTPSAKEFLFDKRPQSDVERIACLAYYLTHYQATPHFKTADLSKLNTEAAQPKMSNTAQAVDNATKAGLLVQAIKGSKQLSAAGELYVQALPDRAAARKAAADVRPRKRSRRSSRGFDVAQGGGAVEEGES